MSKFGVQVKAWTDKTEQDIHDVVKASIVDVCSLVILRTPVDTGRARANWQPAINTETDRSINWMGNDSSENHDLSAPTPSDGSDYSIARVKEIAEQAVGEYYVMTNPVLYADDLEYGSSNQAPAGMLRRSSTQWEGIVLSNIKKVKLGG